MTGKHDRSRGIMIGEQDIGPGARYRGACWGLGEHDRGRGSMIEGEHDIEGAR